MIWSRNSGQETVKNAEDILITIIIIIIIMINWMTCLLEDDGCKRFVQPGEISLQISY